MPDNLINQQLLDRHLTRIGCRTRTSNHGQEAIDAIKRSRWVLPEEGFPLSIVLMDIEMPVLDGLSAVRIIREMERAGEIKGHVPILAVTANARKEQVDTVSRIPPAYLVLAYHHILR
jgi:CheY-like chemotaxis protein